MAEGLSEGKSRRIYLVLRDRIMSNALTHGARLPTENDLARFHRVSRVTVRRALAELERERLIERRRSSGTRVIYQPKSKPMTADISGVLANLTEMGERTASELRAFEYLPAPASIAEALGLELNATVQRSARIRSVKGKPFSYLVAHVPERIGRTYSQSQLATQPLLGLLERSGAKLDRASQRISAVLASPDLAHALDVAMRSEDPAAVTEAVGAMRTVLGEQAGVPDARRPGRHASPTPISAAEATRLFRSEEHTSELQSH